MLRFSTFARTALLLVGVLSSGLAYAHDQDRPGAVYSLSNETAANRVVAFSRDAKGQLTYDWSYPTGGKGTGAGLGDQGAVVLSDDGRWLLAINAGSNELSVFRVHHSHLVLRDVVASGGVNPISVTIADNLVYVLNAGGARGDADNIAGFYLTEQGHLEALPGSTQPLSGANVGPAQVSFARGGDVLVVTEKATNRVDTFVVGDDGRAGALQSTPSSGAVPFGFAVSRRGYAFVSEAPMSALSSYRIGADGALTTVTASLTNHQVAACWVALSKDERFAYTANAGSNSISAYRIAANGSVSLVDASGLTAATDSRPLEMAVTENGRYLYSLDPGARTIVGFRTSPDGHLTRVSTVGDLPATAVGLAAR